MNRFFSVVTTVAVALWLGGLAALVLLVGGLFARSHDLGAKVAPVLFQQFAYYHLAVGGIGLVGVVLWRLRERRRVLTVLAILVGIGLAAALVTEMAIRPKMEQLRRDDLSGESTFKTLHRASETVYSLEALALLVSACLLPWCIAPSARRRDGVSDQVEPARGASS